MISVRLRHPEGSSTLQLEPTHSLHDLHRLIHEINSLPPGSQELRIGFPPKIISGDLARETLLSEVGIRHGDQVVVSVLQGSESRSHEVTKRAVVTASSAPPPPIARSTPLTAPTTTTTGAKVNGKQVLGGTHVEVNGGYLTLRIVPDDNACLFHSIALLLEPTRQNAVPYLRSLIVSTILSNPHQWTAAILGRSSAEYVETMRKVDTWGGAIELAIFSEVYRVEIVSVDVGTGRMDRFGEGEGYSDQVFLVYSGIHYDALTLTFSPPARSNLFPPENLDFDTTRFPTVDSAPLLQAALKLVAELKALHYYTDAANFTLKCLLCGEAIVGEKEARAHAKLTSHTSFGEYDA